MAVGTNSDRLMSDINVTPFVDVMLVLLIIFMVTAPMMTQGVDVTLPVAKSGSLTADQEQLIVSINKNNEVYINDHIVDIGLLQERLIKMLEGRASRSVYFRADRSIPWGTGVQVMSEIRGAGVENLGIVTEPPPALPDENKGKMQKAKS
jgi:biopolymer transport protein TolR